VRIGPDTRALVTGASRGIGRAIALELGARRGHVGLLARSQSDLEEVAAEIQARGGTAEPLVADVGDRGETERAIGRFTAAGNLDLLVANAGVAWYGPFRVMPVEEAERMTRVNWLGTIYTVSAGLPHMLDRASGHLLVVCSGAAHRAFPWAAAYGGTKFAQRGFLEALRHELSGTGVGITGVYPGQVETHLHDDDRAAGRMPDWIRPSMAIGPDRVARAALQGVEHEQPSVYVPAAVRLMALAHGISPALADRMLRRVLGGTAAPWRRG
jgi:short-subunit dehydrogenase